MTTPTRTVDTMGTSTVFDATTMLVPDAVQPGQFDVQLDPAWASLIGVHGGYLAAVAINSPADRPLYACTFLLALALELYGTWVGNWTWVNQVPVLPFVTTNPPGLVSAFYAVLDLLVACAALPFARRFGSPSFENAASVAR